MNHLSFFTNWRQKGSLQDLWFPHLLQNLSCMSLVLLLQGRWKFKLLLSSSEPPAPRTRSAWRWSSRTGLPRPQPRSGWGHTWRRERRRAARRSGPCRRSPSGTGRSNLQVWSLRPSLKGWGWCRLLTTGWGTDCGQERQERQEGWWILLFWWDLIMSTPKQRVLSKPLTCTQFSSVPILRREDAWVLNSVGQGGIEKALTSNLEANITDTESH